MNIAVRLSFEDDAPIDDEHLRAVVIEAAKRMYGSALVVCGRRGLRAYAIVSYENGQRGNARMKMLWTQRGGR